MTLVQKYHELRVLWARIFSVLKHSITKKLLVMVFSIYFILTVAVTLIQMHFEYEFSKEQTMTVLQNIQAMTQESINQAVWEFNAGQVESILKGIFTNKSLVGVKLVLEQNSAVPELSSKNLGVVENKKNTFERLIPYEFNIYHVDAAKKQQNIGKLYLYSSNKVIFQQVKASYMMLIINAMIKTVALWVFFLWAGYNYISKPLTRLTGAIQKLSSGNWNTELISDSKSPNDKTEINTLIDSFNEMTHKLHNTQDKLEHSRNRLNEIFDTMPSALIFINKQRVIQGWNKYIAQETGIAANHAIGHNILEIYPAFKDHLDLIENALKYNKEQQAKNAKLIKKQDDKNRLFNIVVYPMVHDQVSEAVIRIDDVTEQEKNEAGLAQVEKLASVGALIAGVAHEINNPLGSIMQGTQNIQRRIDPSLEANKSAAAELNINLEQQHQYLEKREIIKFLNDIHAAGERASSIVKNMLNFTRRATVDMMKYNIVELINDGLQLAATDFSLQERTDFRQLKVTKAYAADEIIIECCPMEIQQVILNLLKNAAQSLEHKDGAKEITIKLSKLNEQKICIEISDNGTGIPADILDKIYQPFFTTKPIGQGTGLGLSVCRNIIVQKHHGTMEVESTENIGTKFTMVLPILQQN